MLETSDILDDSDQAIVANVLGGAAGFALVLVLLACTCWLRKSTARINEPNDGYQDIREASRVQFRNPLSRKVRKTVSNGVISPQPNALLPTSDSSGPPHFHQFPAAPLPVVPSLSTSVLGVGRGNLTRESSSSELYASVDRNPRAGEIEGRRRSSDSRDNGGNENGEHTYSKIRPPPGTYDEIDDVAIPSTSRTARSLLLENDDDPDPFYSRLSEARNGKAGATIPPPVPRLPLKRASHPYDYPKFLNQSDRDRWQGTDIVDTPRSRKGIGGLGDGGDSTLTTDALYSKIESQYGGSEDPYSSIKSTEEHYSSVMPNPTSNGSSGDEKDNVAGSSSGRPAALHSGIGSIPAYGSIVPKADRFVRARRSRSDGEEYTVIRKPSSHRAAPSAAFEPRAPPVPEKRYLGSVPKHWPARTSPFASDMPSTSTAPDYGQCGATNATGISSAFSSTYSRPGVQADRDVSTNGSGKREPSYRFITVRESLDALRARMEAAAAANADTGHAAVGPAHSDSSLHYYATISEHSYEVVPSRRGSERHAQREDPNLAARPVSYIDDDEYELGADGGMPLLHSSGLSPNSATADSNTSSNTLMNISFHSHTGSHATSTGSHVTLVHVGGSQLASTSPVPTLGDNHPRHSLEQTQRQLDQGRRTARVCRMVSSEDSSSTGAALSIDIENSFRIDENLSMADQRDFSSSVAGDMDVRSGYSLDILDDNQTYRPHRPSRMSYVERAGTASLDSSTVKSPEIVELETLENFNVSSSNSLNEEDIEARLKSGMEAVQL